VPDVRMPNGTIIKNVPKGITQDQLLSRLGANGHDTKLLLQPLEEESFLEKIPVVGGALASVADVPLNLVSGLAGTGKSFTDVFGANNAASNALQSIANYAESLTSAQSRKDEKAAAAIRKEAEGKGIWEEVKAAAKSFAINPLDTAANVVGSALPFAAAAALAPETGGASLAPLALGAASGVGTIKGSISDAVYARAKEAGVSDAQAKTMAEEAQAYGGKNLDQIALGSVLGAVASATGLEGQLGRAIAKRAVADVVEGAAEQQVARGFARRTATAFGKEAIPEGAQAGQERFSQNLAEQRAGYDTDLMAGVAGQAAFEGLAGGILGGAIGDVHGKRVAPTEEAPVAGAEGEAAPAGERADVFKFQQDITGQLAAAAGPDLSTRAKNAIDTLGRQISNDIATPTPESLARSEEYIKSWEDSLDTGMEYEPDVAEPLLRTKLKDDGTPDIDEETGKPIEEGALAEAKRMVAEARKRLEAAPVEEGAPAGEAPGTFRTSTTINGEEQVDEGALRPLTPQSYADRYQAGEGRGDTAADLEMQQYAANNAADIEAEFARRAKQQEAPDGGVGKPTTPVGEGVGTSVPLSSEPTPAGDTVGEVGGLEPEPVGVSGVPPVSPTVSPNAEPGTLRPAPEMKIAPDWLINIADKFGQAELADNWAKSIFGEEAVPTELQTAPILERVETMQAGRQRDLKRNMFDPIIESAANMGVDIGDFNYFLWLDHAAERNREVAKINPQFPEGGAGITSAQAQEGLKQIEAEGLMPKYNILKKKVQELVRYNLQEDVKAKLLSQGQMDALLKVYQNYVPLKGFAADNDIMTADIGEDANAVTARRDEAMRAMRAASPGGSIQEFRRAIGRGSMPLAPLFNLMQDSEQRVRRRVLNMARLPILRQWKKSPAAFDGILNVYTDANPKKVVVGHDRAGNRYAPVPDGMEKEYYRNRENYMIVKDNGVTYYVEFDPTESGQALRRMFENMNPKDMEGAAKNVAAVNNFLKGMLTYKNPLHLMFVAPFRDISSAIATAMHHQNLKGSPAYKKNLAAHMIRYTMPFTGTWGTIARYVFTNKPMDTEVGKQFQEFIREGGAPLHARFTDVQQKTDAANQAIKQLQGKGGTNVLSALNHWVDNLADMMDMSARFATYRAAIEVGIQPADAARLALDSSLNLTRRGEKARGLDLIFPFFATGVEATRKTKRMLTNGRGAVKILGALMAYGVVESMMNAAIGGDDDDDGQENYLDQNNTMRMGRAILYYGQGADDYVKLPIDPMLGYFKFVGNRIGDIMLGNATPGDVTGDLVLGAASVASPVRIPQADAPSVAVAFTPLVGKPIMENILNQNFFGSPIYKESQFDSAPRSELGSPTTGEGWQWLARTINDATGGSEAVKGAVDFQPEVYRHLMEGYLGGPYQLAKQLGGLGAAEGAADIPGVKSFVGTGSEYAPQTKYFENSSNIRQIMNRLSKLTPEQRAAQGAEFTMDTDPRIIEAYQIVDKNLDNISKEQREVMSYMRTSGGYSDEEEKTVLDHYRAEKNKLYSAFNSVYNGVKKGE